MIDMNVAHVEVDLHLERLSLTRRRTILPTKPRPTAVVQLILPRSWTVSCSITSRVGFKIKKQVKGHLNRTHSKSTRMTWHSWVLSQQSCLPRSLSLWSQTSRMSTSNLNGESKVLTLEYNPKSLVRSVIRDYRYAISTTFMCNW